MMRLVYIFCLVVIGVVTVRAQETGNYTHYYIHPVLLNPGATGFNDHHEFLFDYRNKWAGFDGAPRTFTFVYHGRVADRMGLGGQVFSERVGQQRSVAGMLNYAYNFEADLWDVGVGLSTGIQQYRLASVADDPFLDDTDELLAEALDGALLFDASFGAFARYDERLFFGVSFPNLVRTRLSDISGTIEDPNDKFNYTFLAGYTFGIDDRDFTIEPSIAVKSIRRVPFHVDLNLKLSFLEEQLVGGITYSVGEVGRFGLLLGTRISEVRVFYSYDVIFGDFQDYNNGAHELSISFRLPRKAAASAAPDDM